MTLGIAGDDGVAPDALERLLDAAQIAHLVVDHGNGHCGISTRREAAHLKGALGRQHALHAGIRAGSPRVSARAMPLKVASMTWWGCGREHADVQVHAVRLVHG